MNIEIQSLLRHRNPNRREFIERALVGAASAMLPINLAARESVEIVSKANLPVLPYGAVYFRKTFPPKEDWERDYRQASSDGMNAFRHWFMWSAIEVAPGKYDWGDYDKQFDLAAENGITTIIGEILSVAPQWAFRKYPHALVEKADGSKMHSHYTVASATGGWPGLCLDNDDVRTAAEGFLKSMVKRYRDHPGMGAYDVWNELNHLGAAGGCYCEASAEKFSQWLKIKYGDLNTLNKAWYRYSYERWEDVQIPRTIDPYPDSIDFGLFRVDNAVRLLKWRIETIRSLDTKNPVTMHAIPLGALDRVGPETYPKGGSYPVFQAGKLVDIYGYTGGSNHEEWSRNRWLHWAKMDMTRSASRGKPFWAAEMPAGVSWQMKGQKIEESRIATGSDVKLYTLTHLAGGARGIFSPRWRPLLDGPYVGHFAFYGMDGSPTERSEAASEMIAWMQRPEVVKLLEAKPLQGELGLVVVPESQIHNAISTGSSDFYYDSITGAYQGFHFNGLQVDFVASDNITDEYDTLYLPHPAMLPEKVADSLKAWVARGGNLIAEGCPAYFGDRGRAGTRQPNYGLDELFGATEAFVQFTPDLLDDFKFRMNNGYEVDGGLYLQTYAPTTGKVIASDRDGRVIGVENRFGEGRTWLIGTCPGYGYQRGYASETRRFFAEAFALSGKEQHVSCSDERIVARLQRDEATGAVDLWVVNSIRQEVPVTITLAKRWQSLSSAEVLWGGAVSLQAGGVIETVLPARDALVARLRS